MTSIVAGREGIATNRDRLSLVAREERKKKLFMRWVTTRFLLHEFMEAVLTCSLAEFAEST